MTTRGASAALLGVLSLGQHSNLIERRPRHTIALAQAVQILEAVIVNHSAAMTAFKELAGSDVLTARLHAETMTFRASPDTTTPDGAAAEAADDEMEIDGSVEDTTADGGGAKRTGRDKGKGGRETYAGRPG